MSSVNDPNTWTLAQLMKRMHDARQMGLHTWLPGRIVAINKNTRRVQVQPLLMRGYGGPDGARDTEMLPVVQEVPLMFQSGGGGAFSITFPVAVGDTVKLESCEASLDRFLAAGGATAPIDPNDDRRHSLSDAVATLGLSAVPLPAGAYDDEAMVLRALKIKLGDSTANDPVLRVSDLAAIISLFNSHTHVYVMPTGASTPSTTAAPATGMTSPDGSPTVTSK